MTRFLSSMVIISMTFLSVTFDIAQIPLKMCAYCFMNLHPHTVLFCATYRGDIKTPGFCRHRQPFDAAAPGLYRHRQPFDAAAPMEVLLWCFAS